jgi:hypothetical protein
VLLLLLLPPPSRLRRRPLRLCGVEGCPIIILRTLLLLRLRLRGCAARGGCAWWARLRTRARTQPDDPPQWAEPSKTVDMADSPRALAKYPTLSRL